MKTKNIFLFTLFFIPILMFSQKVKIKKGIVYVDKKEYLKVDCSFICEENSIYNLDGKELIFIMTKGDPNSSKEVYDKIKFLGTGKSIESKKTLKGFIKLLYNNKVITESGELNEVEVDKLVEKYKNLVTGY